MSTTLDLLRRPVCDCRSELERRLDELESEAGQLEAERNVNVKQLPDTVLKLVSGYELRVFWYEVFECFRKLALVGMPVVFDPGSVAQLIFGLLIAFATFGALSRWKPYNDSGANRLAQLCQLQIFFALLSKIALEFDPATIDDTRNIDALLCVLALLPFTLGVVLETPLADLVESEQARSELLDVFSFKIYQRKPALAIKISSTNLPAAVQFTVDTPSSRT